MVPCLAARACTPFSVLCCVHRHCPLLGSYSAPPSARSTMWSACIRSPRAADRSHRLPFSTHWHRQFARRHTVSRNTLCCSVSSSGSARFGGGLTVKPLDLGTSGLSVVIFANASTTTEGEPSAYNPEGLLLPMAVAWADGSKSREETPKEGSGNAEALPHNLCKHQSPGRCRLRASGRSHSFAFPARSRSYRAICASPAYPVRSCNRCQELNDRKASVGLASSRFSINTSSRGVRFPTSFNLSPLAPQLARPFPR